MTGRRASATATPSEAVPAWHGLDAALAAAGQAMDPAHGLDAAEAATRLARHGQNGERSVDVVIASASQPAAAVSSCGGTAGPTGMVVASPTRRGARSCRVWCRSSPTGSTRSPSTAAWSRNCARWRRSAGCCARTVRSPSDSVRDPRTRRAETHRSTERPRMNGRPQRDVERAYPLPDFIAKLRRLADALEQGRRFEIRIAGERISVPARAICSIEHERDGKSEEIEFQIKWEHAR